MHGDAWSEPIPPKRWRVIPVSRLDTQMICPIRKLARLVPQERKVDSGGEIIPNGSYLGWDAHYRPLQIKVLKRPAALTSHLLPKRKSNTLIGSGSINAVLGSRPLQPEEHSLHKKLSGIA